MDRRSSPASELDTVRKAQAGDQDSFALLIVQYHERLASLVHLRMGRRLREKVELEDVLQETYMKAWSALPQFEWRGAPSLFHWLGGIAEHVIKNLHRYHFDTKKRQAKSERPASETCGSSDILTNIAARVTSPGKRLQRRERFARLEEALGRLKPEYREVILLARVRGLPTREIAERMGRTREAVAMLLYRASRELRESFGSTGSFYLPASALESLEGDPFPADDKESG